MPRASPDTTDTPLRASSRPSRRAKWRPAALAARVPMMPTRRLAKADTSPLAKSTAGAAKSPRIDAGYSASVVSSTRMSPSCSAAAIWSSSCTVAARRNARSSPSCRSIAAMCSGAGASPRTTCHAGSTPRPRIRVRNLCGPMPGSDASAAATTRSSYVGSMVSACERSLFIAHHQQASTVLCAIAVRSPRATRPPGLAHRAGRR